MNSIPSTSVRLTTNTKFVLSTSGSDSSIVKHNNAFESLGVDLVYFTFKEAISPEQYAQLIKSPFVLGAAVTGRDGMKSNIIPYLDKVEDIALKTQAVNTVVNNNGRLYGYNSDAIGLKAALQKGIEQFKIKPQTAIIYGNGGVAGVAWHVLKELGLRVTITGRNQEKIQQKRAELGIDKEPHFEGPYDLVVDATPVSSQPNFIEAKGLKALLDQSQLVFSHNMPEKDGHTNYLKDYCEANNISFIPGEWMYKEQLIKQYQLYFAAFCEQSDSILISEDAILKAWKL